MASRTRGPRPAVRRARPGEQVADAGRRVDPVRPPATRAGAPQSPTSAGAARRWRAAAARASCRRRTAARRRRREAVAEPGERIRLVERLRVLPGQRASHRTTSSHARRGRVDVLEVPLAAAQAQLGLVPGGRRVALAERRGHGVVGRAVDEQRGHGRSARGGPATPRPSRRRAGEPRDDPVAEPEPRALLEVGDGRLPDGARQRHAASRRPAAQSARCPPAEWPTATTRPRSRSASSVAQVVDRRRDVLARRRPAAARVQAAVLDVPRREARARRDRRPAGS